MNHTLDIPKLLTLRKLTRAVADTLTAELKMYLATLAPLIQPRQVFGEFIRGGTKQGTTDTDKPFRQLQELYKSLARTKSFNLREEFDSPLDIQNTAVEFTPAEYEYQAVNGDEKKTITVTSPLTWILNIPGFGPQRLRELLSAPLARRNAAELQQSLLHSLVLHLTITNRPGVTQLLDGLRFQVSSGRCDEFGELPLVKITFPVSTIRPSDELIIQSTEMSGMSAFEEVIDTESLTNMHDPIKDRLLELFRTHIKS